MRLALSSHILASPFRIPILHRARHPGCVRLCPHNPFSPTSHGQSRRYNANEEREEQRLDSKTRAFRIGKLSEATKDDGQRNGAIERNGSDTSHAHARLPDAQEPEHLEGAGLSQSTSRSIVRMASMTQRDVDSSKLGSKIQLGLPSETTIFREGWRRRLVTFEQYQYQSDFEASGFRSALLVDSPSYSRDWELWLELIVFRRRHHGAKGTIAIYKEIFRRSLRLPTQGVVADQLWDLLLQAGIQEAGLLDEILVYAIRLKISTGRSWSKMYHGIISIALKEDPLLAYNWHVKVRDDFPPSLEDYQKSFKLSVDCGSLAHFESLYLDTPLTGMYKIVITKLCGLQMYTEALKWHELLCKVGDYPAEVTDVLPLLDHLIYIGDVNRFKNVLKMLTEANVGIRDVPEAYARRDKTITREIMNRQLGEIHGIAPKSLSDSFCARLFATQMFSVDTVIKGLHIVASEVIGPLSLREIAFRDDCDPATICQHIDLLKSAGIVLENSAYCTVIRGLAMENKGEMLKSMVTSDLHPDTFADHHLQERLLAQYHKEDDIVKIERTLAVLTTGYAVADLQRVRMNLILRCQVTLGHPEKVFAMLEDMKRMGVAVTARSSRHLRVCWLSRRQVGRAPERVQELSILIQATKMTMQSGTFVPIKSWREILRRLGMAGHLMNFENLALWLVDWYSKPAVKAALLKQLSSSREAQALVEGVVSSEESTDLHLKHYLQTLFTTAALHGIVAWGFQHARNSRNSIRDSTKARTTGEGLLLEEKPQFQWTWGLHLLSKLRARGVPIHKSDVARICRHRLNALFGTGLSKRPINRRAMAENIHPESLYVREMEQIWGKDLFRVWKPVDNPVRHRMRTWRRGRHQAWTPVVEKGEPRPKVLRPKRIQDPLWWL